MPHHSVSDYRGVRLSGCQTIGVSDYRGVRLSGCQTIGVSDYRGVRLSDYWGGVRLLGCQTIGVSDYWGVRLLGSTFMLFLLKKFPIFVLENACLFIRFKKHLSTVSAITEVV